MALIITAASASTGDVCIPSARTARSRKARIYIIDPAKCTECVGHFDTPQCVVVCPVDCIPLDPAHVETRDQLMRKYELLVAQKAAG
jgi:ferredoxin